MRIQHYSVKLVLYLLLMFLILTPGYAHAQKEFVIKSVNTQLDDTVYFLNAVFEINLPDYITSAINQGFDLSLAMEVEIFEKRKFWFDKPVVMIKQQYRIHYHPMLDTVSLLNVNSGILLSFSSVEQSFNYLTVLLNYPLLDSNALNQREQYNARLHFGIDNSELPVPLKSSSLWKNDWDLVSEWHEWDITK